MPPAKKERLLKKCPDCDYSSYHVSKFMEHRRVHTGNKPFRCHICGKECTQNSNLKTHLMIHGEGYKSEFKCKLCGFSTKYKQSFLIHERHHNGEKPYKCNFCEASFSQSTHCLTHMRETHGNIRKFKCDDCGKFFKRRDHLERHLQFHQERRDYVCDICGSGYKDERYLAVHKRIHQGESGKVFKCTLCPYKACFKSSLETHFRLHTGERPYKCAVCEKAFVTSGSHKLHMRMVHAGHAGKSQKCTHCKYTTGSKQALKQHIADKHGDGEGKDCYKCRLCGVIYNSTTSLNKHRRIAHSEEWQREQANTAVVNGETKSTQSPKEPKVAANKSTKQKLGSKMKATTRRRRVLPVREEWGSDGSEDEDEMEAEDWEVEGCMLTQDTPAPRRSLRRTVRPKTFVEPSDDDDDYGPDATDEMATKREQAAGCDVIPHGDEVPSENVDSERPPEELEACEGSTDTTTEKNVVPSEDATANIVKVANKTWKCEFCPSEFSSRWQHYRHKLKNHSAVCSNIQKKTQAALTSCQAKDRLITTGKVKCNICSKSFTSKLLCNAHMKKWHTQNTADHGEAHAQTFHCKVCDRKFVKERQLAAHARRCERMRASLMRRHCDVMRRQLVAGAGEMSARKDTFPCSYCTKRFLSENGALQHMRQQHSTSSQNHNGGPPRYACYLCSRQYAVRSALSKHMSKQHPENYEEYSQQLITMENLNRARRETMRQVKKSPRPCQKAKKGAAAIELELPVAEEVKVEPPDSGYEAMAGCVSVTDTHEPSGLDHVPERKYSDVIAAQREIGSVIASINSDVTADVIKEESCPATDTAPQETEAVPLEIGQKAPFENSQDVAMETMPIVTMSSTALDTSEVVTMVANQTTETPADGNTDVNMDTNFNQMIVVAPLVESV